MGADIMSMKILCDFDGTVTKNDNMVSIIKEFVPSFHHNIVKDIINKEISIRDGLEQLFATISSSKKEEITSFVLNTIEFRDGFSEFIEYTNKEELDFYIVSGGLDFFVEPTLANFVPSHHIYCASADFSMETMHINWVHECDDQCSSACGVCKPTVLRKLPTANEKIIVIGDSVTDFELAKQADIVFARDILAAKCTELNIPFTPFETFYDILLAFQKGVN